MEKVHIALVGRQNVGKSSLINAITGDKRAIVSAVAGTTTDPVRKIYEIPNYAPVVFIDTAGIDDMSTLGPQRIEKTYAAVNEADFAILLFSRNQFGLYEQNMIAYFKQQHIPFLLIHTHRDQEALNSSMAVEIQQQYQKTIIDFSTFIDSTDLIIETIKTIFPIKNKITLMDNLIHQGDTVILVTPIDSEAPTGRLILPQVQTIRHILDTHAIVITLQPSELTHCLSNLSKPPALIITDSQVFDQVAQMIPETIPLTSFSILMARAKGQCNFDYYRQSITSIETLNDNDRILILESCSHHSSCDDIGRVKIPRLLQRCTGKKLQFEVIPSLSSIPEPLSRYAMVIQCGGCMVTSTQLQRRIQPFIEQQIPVSNYGMVIAYTQGIFDRVMIPFIKKAPF